jgi:hypothetical protein
MRSLAHVWITSNSATSQLVNSTFVHSLCILKQTSHQIEKGRKTRHTHAFRLGMCSCALRRTTERHTRNIILTWYKRCNVKIRVISIW